MRFLKYLLLAIFLMPVMAYFAINYAIDEGSQEMVSIVRQQAVGHGIHIEELKYDRVSISSLRSVTWSDIHIRFRGIDERFISNRAEFIVKVSEITVSLLDYSSNVIHLSVNNFSAAPTSEAVKALMATDPKLAKGLRSGSLEGKVFEIFTVVDFDRPLQSTKPLANDLADIAKTGSTKADIRFEGKARMNIRGTDLEAKILSDKRGDQTWFVLDRNDVARISQVFNDKLTVPEIVIIADNPAKAPLLFTIKDYAETMAKNASSKDRSVPEDPYRHVLWSYLLTKEFGPEFAKQVTDAHEEGPTGNTPMERQQDYNNNAVGRQYAELGIPEVEILHRVRTDPKVMKKWNRKRRKAKG